MNSWGGTVPQSVCKLLKALERIKMAYPTGKECDRPKASMTEGGSSKKRMVTFSGQIPKKSHKDAKHCALCYKSFTNIPQTEGKYVTIN